ncbi:MAG: hypothetical protein A2W23_06245 [Planctomycetes bacterium RBG_16_43_13]|nr:MAG: hypothetical protein A2W23_06245 [Planctomycetes bacterium RBG_16_43_13]
MKIAGYCRVSSDKQADEGVSLEVQESQIRKYAELYDIELLEIVVDAGESAKNLKRPGMQKIIELMDFGLCDGVLVIKLDRLTRSVKDLCYLLERYFSKDKILISVQERIDTNSAMGRMIMNMVMSISQWEREATSERTKTVLAHKKSNGERIGNIPYGYRVADDGVHIEADEMEQKIIFDVINLRKHGMPFKIICEAMVQNSQFNRQGKPFSISAIHKIAHI